MALTAKQEKFVENLVSGMTQRQAYKDAYDAENMKDETIDTEACLLYKDQKIAKRYQELLDQSANIAIMSAIERKIWLSKVIKGEEKEDIYINQDGVNTKVGSKNADLNTKIKAMDVLNKMSGEYITKIDADVKIDKLEDIL